MCIFRIQAPDRHGSESEKEGMWLKIGEIGAVGGLLPCLPFGPGPGLGLVAALPAIWSDLTTDAGDKRIHHRRWEKFKGGARCSCCLWWARWARCLYCGNEGKTNAMESRRTNHPVNLLLP